MSRGTILITGVAGFIGSHLAERLLEMGYQVNGIDSFSDYYPRSIKEGNLERARTFPNFRLFETDLCRSLPQAALADVEKIFHLAAQPGVRKSWGPDFGLYIQYNVAATQVLLESIKGREILKFVYASSSSVYGNKSDVVLKESDSLQPCSPYGVTKLAAEHLCHSYWENYGVPIVSLRFFTVFGPRQRPDMAFQRMITALLQRTSFDVYGTGTQKRDFTYVSDIVDGLILAASIDVHGEVFNLGGTNVFSLLEVITMLNEIGEASLEVRFKDSQKGDVQFTRADIIKAQTLFGYLPKVRLKEGLQKQLDYEKHRLHRSTTK